MTDKVTNITWADLGPDTTQPSMKLRVSRPTPRALVGEMCWRLGLPRETNDEFGMAADQILAALDFAGYQIVDKS